MILSNLFDRDDTMSFQYYIFFLKQETVAYNG